MRGGARGERRRAAEEAAEATDGGSHAIGGARGKRRRAEREANRERARAYRRRRAEGIALAQVPYSDAAVEWLVALGRLRPDQTDDRTAVDAAMAVYLSDLLKQLFRDGPAG